MLVENSDVEEIGKQIGQAHLVIRCVVRALARQPNFDAKSFIDILAKEEQQMTNSASGAKDVLKLIISEVEGYS